MTADRGWNVSNDHTIWGLTGFQWNVPISWAAWIMGLAQIPFIINFFWSIKHGEKVNDNPWEATTLENGLRRRRRRTAIFSPRQLHIAART